MKNIRLELYNLIQELHTITLGEYQNMEREEISSDDYEYCRGYTSAMSFTIEKLRGLIQVSEINLETYLKTVNVNAKDINDWEDLSEALNYYTDGNLWAYPLEELDYCLEEEKNFVIVDLGNGNKALAELPEEMK